MGTRADFYIENEWLGSLGMDGYPMSLDETLLKAKTPAEFKAHLPKDREDWTSPEMGWPWPWETSATTDYAYVFKNGKVNIHNFDRKYKWPNMKALQKVAFGKRSGLIIVKSVEPIR